MGYPVALHCLLMYIARAGDIANCGSGAVCSSAHVWLGFLGMYSGTEILVHILS